MLKVSVTDAGISWHLKNRLGGTRTCSMKAFVVHFKHTWSQVRGVGKVIIQGAFPEVFCEELQAHMESQPCTFLRLPQQVLNKIYEYAANVNDGPRLLRRFVAASRAGLPLRYPRMTTPTILLLNHQIHEGARKVIFALSLRIELQGLLTDMQRVPDVFRFISRETFAKTVHLRLIISHWTWTIVLPDLVRVLEPPHKLRSMHLHLQYHPHNRLSQELHEGLSSLTRLRILEVATVVASLVEPIYTRGLERNMMDSPAGQPTWPLYRVLEGGSWQQLPIPPPRQYCVGAEYPVEREYGDGRSLGDGESRPLCPAIPSDDRWNLD